MLVPFVQVRICRRFGRVIALCLAPMAVIVLSMVTAGAGSARDTIDLTNPSEGRPWPPEVPFTICEMHIKDKQGRLLTGADLASVQERRGCIVKSAKNPPYLHDATAQKIRDAIKTWNDLFGYKIKFTELYVRGKETNIVQFLQAYRRYDKAAQMDRGICGTENVGFFRSVDINHVYIDANCTYIASPQGMIPGLGKYSIIHEMMHVIGVYHEQQRIDRKDYIDVKPLPATSGQVCPKDYAGALKQFTVMGRKDGDYDFESVMHYKLRLNSAKTCAVYMAVNTRGTALLAAKGLSLSIIGQRDTISDGDIAAVRALYP